MGDDTSIDTDSDSTALTLEAAEAPTFDFTAHREAAQAEYAQVAGQYLDFAKLVGSLLQSCTVGRGIAINSLDFRGKELESFGKKAAKASSENPNQPRYSKPLEQITDMAGVRVITFFLAGVQSIEPIVYEQFQVVEKIDKSAALRSNERLGYHSVHYIIELTSERTKLPEYARFRGLKAEIQVRTILQHAWAEIEHDVQYKAPATLPTQIRRRFMTLAGMLEIADREFQSIQTEDARLRSEAIASVALGELSNVEITPSAIKAYLDKAFGSDGRMSEWSYEWAARIVLALGFVDLAQVDDAIRPYNADRISRLLHGGRQGQVTRFEDSLLAALGDRYVEQHPWANSQIEGDAGWFQRAAELRLEKLRKNGVDVGGFKGLS